eukprot:gene15313-32441_t
MTTFADSLKKEIARVARKALREEIAALRKTSVVQRSEVAALKKQLKALQTQVSRLSKGQGKANSEKVRTAPSAEQEPSAVQTKVKPGRKVVFTAERLKAQRARLKLPLLPTTTIGSFPQTAEIRAARGAFKRGALDAAHYQQKMEAEIALAVRKQEALGIDVLVHGEAERNDMVEYFGEQLEGYAFSQFGWVQSYGSRCVKPRVIYGDVARPRAMTVAWTVHAQSLTSKPVKGMLTGPVTILQWSFVRDDQPRATTADQIAWAIREGLPLRRAGWKSYLERATRAFRISASGVRNDTQIHTHMCYSEFNDILPAI